MTKSLSLLPKDSLILTFKTSGAGPNKDGEENDVFFMIFLEKSGPEQRARNLVLAFNLLETKSAEAM